MTIKNVDDERFGYMELLGELTDGAVKHALQLAQQKWNQQSGEDLDCDVYYDNRTNDGYDPDEGYEEYHQGERIEFTWNPPPDPLDDEPEVEEIWRTVGKTFRATFHHRNRRGRMKHHFNMATLHYQGSHFIPGQRRHGSNDTRRLRRNDATGKMLGGKNGRSLPLGVRRVPVLTHVIVNGRLFKVGRA